MADLNLARQNAMQAALYRFQRGEASITELAAQLTANYDAAAAAAFTVEAAIVIATAPALIPQTGKTGVVTLLSTGTHAIDLPAISGRRPLSTFGGFLLTTRSATTVTGTLTFSVGNNSPNFNNMIVGTNVAAAAFNATAFALPFFLPLAIGASTGGAPDMATAPTLNITAALGGVATLQGRFGLQALYV